MSDHSPHTPDEQFPGDSSPRPVSRAHMIPGTASSALDAEISHYQETNRTTQAPRQAEPAPTAFYDSKGVRHEHRGMSEQMKREIKKQERRQQELLQQRQLELRHQEALRQHQMLILQQHQQEQLLRQQKEQQLLQQQQQQQLLAQQQQQELARQQQQQQLYQYYQLQQHQQQVAQQYMEQQRQQQLRQQQLAQYYSAQAVRTHHPQEVPHLPASVPAAATIAQPPAAVPRTTSVSDMLVPPMTWQREQSAQYPQQHTQATPATPASPTYGPTKDDYRGHSGSNRHGTHGGHNRNSNVPITTIIQHPFEHYRSRDKSPIEFSTTPAGPSDSDDDFGDLSESDIEVLRRQVSTEKVKVNFLTLFRYATRFDIFILTIGMITAAAAGVCMPLFTVIFGQMTNEFLAFIVFNSSASRFQHQINHYALYFVYIAIATFCLTSIKTYITVERGERLSARIRQNYLKAILRQNIGYFDKLGAGEVTNRITTDTNLIQEGISEKLGLIVSAVSSFITSLVIGFIKSARLTGIMISTVVALVLAMGICSTFLVRYVRWAIADDSECSSIAEECFSSITNIVAFGMQIKMDKRYERPLNSSLKNYLLKARVLGAMVGILWCITYCMYALALWEGSRLINKGETSIGHVITVLMALMIGAFQLGGVAPNMESLGSAIGAGKKIFETIDRVPDIDSLSGGDTIPNLKGAISFKNVHFRYPSRPGVPILREFDLDVPSGATVALVGASGSGKSTIIALLERFYQPLGGSITVDGVDILSLDVKWLRQQMSLVSQEPTLFNCTIFENIAHGLIGTEYENADRSVQLQLVEEACEQANCSEFINTLTDGLDTQVGEKGYLLSGGQKQRVAIARAIISNPPILLLDEATSALDTRSEKVVQQALDRAARHRTTIVIAHRLSTIKNADKIVVMSKGEILEQGSHDQLIAARGTYYELVGAQRIEDGSTDTIPSGEKGYYWENSSGSDFDVGSRISEKKPPPLNTWGMIKLLARFNKNERWPLLIGSGFAVICGAGYPSLALLYGSVMQSFMVDPLAYKHMLHEIDKFSGFFFMVGMVQLGSYFMQVYYLGVASETLVRNLKRTIFSHLLNQDLQFFDTTTTGQLTSSLSKDTQNVQGLGGATFGQILSSVVTVIISVILSCCYTWKLGLVCSACIPLILSSGFFRFYILTQLNQRGRKVYESSAGYACEATNNIQTVIALTREEDVLHYYSSRVNTVVYKSARSNAISSMLFGASQTLIILINALGFWYGSTLIRKREIDINQFFVAFVTVVFGVQSAGSIFSFTPDMGKAKVATQNIHEILKIEPVIGGHPESGIMLDREKVVGNIAFDNVRFRYPERPKIPVLQGLNLSIPAGCYVALVGSSGCGKSTTISLMERFYDALHGSITIDGIDIRDINLKSYRSLISLVQQEPILFTGTIRENILLGSDGDVDDVTLHSAAIQANIHNFVMSLPDGYDTFVGNKGTLLSGGQKQRVAIARALIRDPKILLLDEATSALDSESEKVVQQALDAAAQGRTTIVVAHRLSTIQNADCIYVLEDGKVLEQGTHSHLMAQKGRYYELVKLQALEG
ncbi:Leptomycin B resistance protein [Yarrowia sp. B02]|nr:Leptomycin B resistance protein [Yarrowia sp. B02]